MANDNIEIENGLVNLKMAKKSLFFEIFSFHLPRFRRNILKCPYLLGLKLTLDLIYPRKLSLKTEVFPLSFPFFPARFPKMKSPNNVERRYGRRRSFLAYPVF